MFWEHHLVFVLILYYFYLFLGSAPVHLMLGPHRWTANPMISESNADSICQGPTSLGPIHVPFSFWGLVPQSSYNISFDSIHHKFYWSNIFLLPITSHMYSNCQLQLPSNGELLKPFFNRWYPMRMIRVNWIIPGNAEVFPGDRSYKSHWIENPKNPV